MKIFVYSILLIIISSIGYAEESMYIAERLSTDFKGIVRNDEITIIYGNNGIIFKTSDLGNTWEQQDITQNENIKIIKMIYSHNSFLAFSDIGTIYSSFDGNHWLINDFQSNPIIKDVAVEGNFIYILTKEKILKYDYKYNIISEKILDSNFKLLSITATNDNLFCIKSDYSLYRISNILSDDFKIIDYSPYGKSLKNISFINNNLYCIIDDNLYIYDESSFTFELVQRIVNTYNVYNNRTFFVRKAENQGLKIKLFDFFESYGNNSSSKINTSELDRYCLVELNGIAFLNDDIIIGYGDNKTIVKSTDGGRNWEIVCNLVTPNTGTPSIKFINDSVGFFIFMPRIYRTTNAGLTWIPQKLTDQNLNRINNIASSYLDNDGNIVIICLLSDYLSDSTMDRNYMYSTDFGKNWNYGFNKNFYMYKNYAKFGMKLTKVDSNYYWYFEQNYYPNSIIHVLDKNLKFLKTIKFDSLGLRNIKFKNNTLIGIANDGFHDGNRLDSVKNLYLIKSEDLGMNWSITDTFKFYNVNGVPAPMFWNDDDLINAYYEETSKILKIHYYNEEDKKFNDILTFIDSSLNDISINLIDKKLYISSNRRYRISDSTIISEDYNTNNPTWRNIKFLDIDMYDIKFFSVTDNYIYGLDKKTTWGMMYGIPVPLYYQNHLMRFKKRSSTDVEIKPSNYGYIFVAPSYPNPAKQEVNFLIYFDNYFDIENDNIEIIDIYGKKIAGKSDIIFNKQSNISSILTWNCSAVADGVYLLVITHGNSKRAIKVMVSK